MSKEITAQTDKEKMAIVKTQKICVEEKHEGHFFENVLTEIVDKGYLEQEVIGRIQVELINLWTKQIESFNKGKSSSITEEKAKSLLESIYNTLGFRLKVLEDLDESIPLMQNKPIQVLFEEGQELMEKRFEMLRQEYEILCSRLLPIDQIAYRATYDEGLAPFFKFYSVKYESQECPCSIDYPLSNDKMERIGLDYMMDYIDKSLMEHDLCLKYEVEEIKGLLESYHKGYKELLVNFYELILMNAIGRTILGKDISTLELTEEDIEKIEKALEILPTATLEKTLVSAGMKILEQFGLDSVKMKQYVVQTIKKFVPRIELVLEDEVLNQVFIVAKKNQSKRIHYISGNKLSNEDFKTLTEEIRTCSNVQEKIWWIKQKVQHVEDLKDVLEADCIWKEEFQAVYTSLEDIEIALLLNVVQVDENDIDLIEADMEEEWYSALKQYLKILPPERREAIRTCAQHINPN